MQLGDTIVPLDLRPGTFVPIPCRHCDKAMIRFSLAEGSHTLACPRCNCITDIRVYLDSGTLRVKTAKGAVRVKPSNP